jgi:hypothetical protein
MEPATPKGSRGRTRLFNLLAIDRLRIDRRHNSNTAPRRGWSTLQRGRRTVEDKSPHIPFSFVGQGREEKTDGMSEFVKTTKITKTEEQIRK